ncbi:hypothetical protein BH10PSE14_BH10PSE14_31560 [soil metagenome]
MDKRERQEARQTRIFPVPASTTRETVAQEIRQVMEPYGNLSDDGRTIACKLDGGLANMLFKVAVADGRAKILGNIRFKKRVWFIGIPLAILLIPTGLGIFIMIGIGFLLGASASKAREFFFKAIEGRLQALQALPAQG